jgi:hypothetical protein
MPLAKQAEVSEMLNDMQRCGVIEESDSPWSSPVTLVRKKNGELSFCVDYRKLNTVTKKDCFLLPQIDGHSRHAGWSQMVLHSRSEEQVLVSRCTSRRQEENGILGWSRIMAVYSHAFWPLQSPATFERLMETVL